MNDNNKYYEVDLYPNWLKIFDISDLDKFKRIIQFFVFNCPLKDLSIQYKDLESYGWEKEDYNNDSIIVKEFYKIFDFKNEENLFIYKNSYEIKKTFENILNLENDNIFQKDYNSLILLNSDTYIIKSFFRFMRNGFAHSRFTFNNDYLFIENGLMEIKKFKFKLKSKMRVRIVDLLKFIDFITNEGIKYQNLKHEKKASTMKNILEIVRTEHLTNDKLIEKINPENINLLKELKREKIIIYDRSKKCWVVVEDSKNGN